MTILYLLTAINYLVALFLLWQITDDEVWTLIVRDIKATMDLTEQNEFTKRAPIVRKVFCWLLLIPGVGLAGLAIILKNTNSR